MFYKLEADGIQLTFGERPILSDIYFTCETGKIVGLLGRNGEGKSSLLQVIFGSITCDSSVRINGQHVKQAFRYKGLINYLPQFDFVPPNFRVREVFKSFDSDYSEFLARYPEKSILEATRFRELSGGERRFIQTYLIITASTLFSLLDEPFTHLSPVQNELICQLLNDTKHRKGFIVTDHLYRYIVEICDHCYFLKDRRLRPVKDLQDLEGYIFR